MTVDLEELKKLAQDFERHDNLGTLVRFQEKATPAAVLALIERVEEAERHAAFLTDWSQATTEVVCGERPKGIMVATTLEAVRELNARVATLEALARKGLEAYHLEATCPLALASNPGESAECEHAECREWAAALEAKP